MRRLREIFLPGVRFLWKLPGLLRHPITVDDARETLRQRLARRDRDFLAFVKRAIYEHAASPYRALLIHAGCEYEDLERLVSSDGVEAALQRLVRHGVYLTVAEFKGRTPVVRGSFSIEVDPTALHNPAAATHILSQSGGSGGEPMPAYVDLAFVRERAVDTLLVHHARGGRRWRNAIWKVPGGVAMVRILEFSAIGAPPVRWFSPIDAASAGLQPHYRWSSRVVRLAGLLAGVPLPVPRYVSLDDPLPIVRWMDAVRGSGFTPHLHTTPSAAVRLCTAAREAGKDLCGVQFTLASEATTAARLAVVRRTGADTQPCYAAAECGPIGYGCLAPESADEMHILHDLNVVIQPPSGSSTTGLPEHALLISSLRPTAPLVLLNVCLGDEARMRRRQCGCPLARLGWTTQLSGVRSYEKLTAAGMTFLDADVTRVLDEVLPARFGGLPTHYQLVEDEIDDGQPRLRLFVHPVVGPIDAASVADTFLRAIGRDQSLGQGLMELVWRETRLLQIERGTPMVTPSGKILHLHRWPRAATAREAS